MDSPVSTINRNPVMTARQRHLRVAAELAAHPSVAQPAFPYVVSLVSPSDAAAEAGLTRAGFYRLWPSKLEFWADLTCWLAAGGVGDPAETDGSDKAADAAAFAAGGALERTRVASNRLQARLLADPWITLRTSLLAFPDHERVAPLVTEATQRAIDATAARIDELLCGSDLVPIEPITVSDLAAAMFCVADGLAAAGRLTPSVNEPGICLDGRLDRPWGLLAYALRKLIEHRTRPRRPGEVRPARPRPAAPSDLEHRLRLSSAQAKVLHRSARLYREAVQHDRWTDTGGSLGPLGHVTLARVARRAGVSRQAIQRAWTNQADLNRDLMRLLVEQELVDLRGALRRASIAGFHGRTNPVLAAADHAIARFTRLAAENPLRNLVYACPYQDPAVRAIGQEGLETALRQHAVDQADIIHELERHGLGGHHGGLDPDVTGREISDHPRFGADLIDLSGLTVLTVAAAGRLNRTNATAIRPRLAVAEGAGSSVAAAIHSFSGATLPPSADGSLRFRTL